MDAPMPTESARDPVVLTDLPEEVLVLILTALDLPDACAALSTCKYIHETFKSSSSMLYAHHARIAGVLDNSSRRDDFSTRLLELKNSERAWRQLAISRVKNIGIPHRPSGIYDLTGGKYFLGRTDGVPTFVNATGATKAICSISLSDYFEDDAGMQYASAGADQPGEWPSIDVGEDIIDVGINSSEHDLIGVVTTAIIWGEATRPKRRVSLHLIQMSTGAPHPEARTPVVPIYEAHDLDTRPSIMLEVVGDVMALLLNWHQIPNSSDVFYIIDWKAGRITMERALDLFHYYSFIFLAPDVLALSCSKPFSIQLARLPRTWDTPPLPGQKPAKLEIARTLLLPSLEDNVWVTHFSCRSEPNPTLYGRRYGRCSERNFTPDPRDAIALFHVLVRKISTQVLWGEASSMSFVAHRATLLSLIDWEPPDEAYSPNQKPSTSLTETPGSPVSVTNDGSSSSEDAGLTPLPLSNGESACEQVTGKETRTIPWATWGNKATQWFSTDHILTNWITTSCGTRLVLTEESESETGSNLTVYDFNWNRVKKAIKAAQYLRDEEYESETWECPASPFTVDEESTFAVDNAQSVIPGAWITPDMMEGTPEQHIPTVTSVNPEEIKGYPVGDWIVEEWTMNSDDCVLGRSENDQQSGDIRLINGDIPLPPSTNRFFKEQVVGGLPFIAVKRVVEETYQSVLMEEECLIGLKATNDDGINSIDILHVG